MKTRIFTPGQIHEAGLLLRSGGLVAFPSETVYGLGGNALMADSARAIYTAKGRPSDNPLIVHLPSMDRIHRAVEDVDPISECIGASLWPGPLTIILPKNPAIPKGVTGGLDTVGIRIPDDPLAQELLRYADVPVAAPSANRSGRPSPTAFWMVQRDLAGRIDGIIQGPDTRIGLESTIIQVQSGKVVILRPGVIGVSQIQEVLGVQGMDHIQVQYANEQSFAVPGTRYRHYSPSMEVQAFEDLASLQAKLKAAQKINPDVRYAVLTTQRFAAMPDLVCTNRVIVYADLEQYAHQLFRDMVEIEGEDYQLLFLFNPDLDVAQRELGGFGFALRDRIHRAAGEL